jgi:hypothetical protein
LGIDAFLHHRGFADQMVCAHFDEGGFMQVDLNLIPQFDAVLNDSITGAVAAAPGGLGIPEFLFFLATYLWERTGGEGASLAVDALF